MTTFRKSFGVAKKLKISLFILVLIFIIGTLGYHYIEDWSFTESLYTTVITLATVGYGDFHPQQTEGRVFTVVLIVFGVGAMAYTIRLATEAMVEGQLKKVMGRGKLKKKVEKLAGHYIVCGYGRIGHIICREFAAEQIDFVVIDDDPEVIQKIDEKEYIYYKGNATEDKTLLGAGIKKAKGIVCVLSTDAKNLYTILTAKELNPNIYILSRSEDETSEHRLIRAGANRVISPYFVGGMRMAMAVLRPAMLDFIEITTKRQSLELRIEKLFICNASHVIDKSLEEVQIRQRYGLIIVAIEKASGQMIFNPVASYVIEDGDKLIALGENANLIKFSEECKLEELKV
jgi:voltage-gated potassium channel